MKFKMKKGSTVEVISGSAKGTKGTILEMDKTKLLVRVQGVKMQTHFDKKEGQFKKEGFIHYSNLRLVDAAPEVAKKKTTKKKTANP